MADFNFNFDSSDIRVFPTSRRNASADQYSALNTEKNLTSLVNRLSQTESFIIDGLDISSGTGGTSIAEGSMNIGGYYFQIFKTTIISSDLKPSSGIPTYEGIVAKIKVLNTFQKKPPNTDSAVLNFTELLGTDMDTPPTSSGWNLDTDGEFIGLQICSENLYSTSTQTVLTKPSKSTENNITTYTLPLAIYENNSWKKLNDTVAFKDSQIRIVSGTTPRISGLYSTSDQPDTLAELLDNLIIDDGEI